ADRPIEERLKRLPVLVELSLKIANAFRIWLIEHQQFRGRRLVGPPKLGETFAVFRGMLARYVEQIVAHENSGEIDIGTEPSKLGVHFLMVGIQLIELTIDRLSPARGGHQRYHDEQQKTSEPECGDPPRPDADHRPPSKHCWHQSKLPRLLPRHASSHQGRASRSEGRSARRCARASPAKSPPGSPIN